jgi:zinc protease
VSVLVELPLSTAARANEPRGSNGYAVVVSKATAADPDWKQVVEALRRKHDAAVIVYDGDVREALAGLKRSAPRYACFVARPQEAGRAFAVQVNRLTRQLDDDPYTDVLWGILTGYKADDALRIARAEQPLLIHKAVSGTSSFDLGPFQEGMIFDEGAAGAFTVKSPDGKTEKKSGPQDSTRAIVDALNHMGPDLVMTSGHATERDWQIGYSYKNGQLRCKDGRLFGLDMKGEKLPIDSPNPKVYLASGNCLAGHVANDQSMALAWMSSGGVRQMIGYVAVTWYGRGGWGTRDYFFDVPGRYTLTEAFFFNQQLLIHDLQKRFPATAKHEVQDWGERGLGKELARLGYREFDNTARDHLGLLWDRDAVAFYGDPAWQARLDPHDLPVRTELTQKGDVYTLSVIAERTVKPGKPLALFLPHRVGDVRVTSGQEFEPLITHRFVMLFKQPTYEKGKTYQVVFEAKGGGGS